MRTGLIDGLFGFFLIALEIIAIFLYGFYFKHVNEGDTNVSPLFTMVSDFFPYYQDLHILVFMGFALLLTSFHKFRTSAIVQCFWVCALSVQFYFLWRVFWTEIFEADKFQAKNFNIDPMVLIKSDFCALSMIIAISATMGKANDFQALGITILGVGLYALNEVICLSKVATNAVDFGGSMIVHTFGAFYGIGVTLLLRYNNKSLSKPVLPNSFEHQITSLIGTIFIWCYWPSYNSSLVVSETTTFKGILNTYFALIASVVFAFATSKLVIGSGKFSMYHVFHASLSGGVIMAASAVFVKDGYASYLVGSLIGILSTLYIHFVLPKLQAAGMLAIAPQLSLHAIPGLLGGFLSAIWVKSYTDLKAGNQVAATFISMGIGLFGGVIVGLIVRVFHDNEQNEQYQGFMTIAVEEQNEDGYVVAAPVVAQAQPTTTQVIYTEAPHNHEEEQLKQQ